MGVKLSDRFWLNLTAKKDSKWTVPKSKIEEPQGSKLDGPKNYKKTVETAQCGRSRRLSFT